MPFPDQRPDLIVSSEQYAKMRAFGWIDGRGMTTEKFDEALAQAYERLFSELPHDHLLDLANDPGFTRDIERP